MASQMSNSQRSFVSKRNKMTAADVRRHVMTGSLLLHPQYTMPSDANSGPPQTIALIETAEPLDVEDVLSQRKSSSTLYEHSVGNANFRRITEFPVDDIEVRLVHREQSTVESPVSMDLPGINPVVKDIIQTYNDDFSLLQRKYRQFSSGNAYIRMQMERPLIVQTAPKQVFEVEFERSIGRSVSTVGEEQIAKRDSSGSHYSSDSMCTAGSSGDTNRDDTLHAPHKLHSSASDPTVPGVIQRISNTQLDQINEARRLNNRQNFVVNLMHPQVESEVIERRSVAPFPVEHCGQKLFIKVLQLHLEPSFEPIFGSIALFDLKEKRKITENFYFDLNDYSMQTMVAQHVGAVDEASKCIQAMFSISSPLNDIFIVIKFEKILQACEVADACEPYQKEDRNLDRLSQIARQYCERLGAYRMPLAWIAVDLNRVLSGSHSADRIESAPCGTITANTIAAQDIRSASPVPFFDVESIISIDRVSCSSNGTFRRVGSGVSMGNSVTNPGQPQKCRTPLHKRKFFGGLYHDDASVSVQSAAESVEGVTVKETAEGSCTTLSSLQPTIINLSAFFRHDAEKLCDEDLCNVLIERRSGGSRLTRLKTFPASLKLEISGVCDESLMRLTPELLRVHPYVPGNPNDIMKEIIEFPRKGVYAVNACYRNLLYIYPRSVNFSNRSGPSRNITIRVELMNEREMPMNVIFGKSSCPKFSSYQNTTVLYHNKMPNFYDEIKIALPPDLNDGHHLLFTFSHISCKPNKGTNSDELEFPIGYSWIPLTKDGRLQTGEFVLPVALDRLPASYGYLSPNVNLPNIKWLDGHKPLFSIELRAISTVHTQDSHLDTFLNACHCLKMQSSSGHQAVTEVDLKIAIRGVIKARPEPMIAFLYVILDKLLVLIANPPYTTSLSAVCFEVLGQLVKICTVLLDGFRDAHGRSSLLTTYIQYHKIAPKEITNLQHDDSSLPTKSKLNAPSENKHLFDIIRNYEQNNQKKTYEESEKSSVCMKRMHEELVLQWIISSGAAREMAFLNSWFFLELLIKSMAEHLSASNRLYLPRKLRFSESFLQNLNELSKAMIGEVLQRTSKDPRQWYLIIIFKQSQSINASWAFFLRDSFSLMDRSFVMCIVKQYNREIAAKIASAAEPFITTMMLLKLDFLRVIASHEHFIALNLPFGGNTAQANMSASHSASCFQSIPSSGSDSSTSLSVSVHSSAAQQQPPSPSNSSLSSRNSTNDSHMSIGSAELSNGFRSRHFLIGLILADLAAVLETSNHMLHSRAIGLVRNILSTHEADTRLQDTAVKARVASLYLPLIGTILDICSRLHDPSPMRTSSTLCAAAKISPDESRTFFSVNDSGPFINDKVMLAIGGISFSPPCSPSTERRSISLAQPSLSPENTRQLLACLSWTLKNMERFTLRQWIRDLSPNRISQFLCVLQLSVSCFEFKPILPTTLKNNTVVCESNASQMDETLVGDGSSTKELSCKKSRATFDADGVRWRSSTKEPNRKQSTKSGTYSSGGNSIEETLINEEELSLEAVLCTEVPLIVLDTLELVMRVISIPGSDHLLFILPSVLKILMHMLSCNQSVQSLENIFASQRAIVIKYPNLIFEQETEQCAELCLHLLRHCASRLPSVRSQAAASLYLLMRQSFESGANLSKVKMQITMSLSTLVSTGTRHGHWINEDCLRRSLKTVLTYSETDASTDSQLRTTTFSEQVKDLVFNLHMILSDTVKMKEYTDDFEMLIDLMYRVAKGYQNNPDLRLTWLINMANKHAARNNAAEAAQCMLHAAALAAEYISMRDYNAHLQNGAAAFSQISDNILEESAVSDDVISPDEEGICESRHFTQGGLVHLVEKTVQFLEKAQMYESMLQLYKVIMPILEESRDYRHLAQVHNRLSDALSRIEPTTAMIEDISDAWFSPLPSMDKRCFGTYFRVGFYGSRFADLDGVEFIYKEPAITKLSEISHRLEAFYTDRFGKGVVEIIKDSNVVDRNHLDQNKAFLQITYVEPYLENWERRRRPTHFERNHKLYRFVYATPFTKDGRPHGDLKDQYKRRTILTTQYSFPYVKTRFRVVSREQCVLSPIEVAIEDVQKKTRELAAAIAQDPPDAKMLQMVLQGCIGTTVNQGPIEVANVFLTNVVFDERGKPLDKFQNKLRLSFKDFSKKCADALHKNKLLIQSDQLAYQNELQKNYIEFTKKMAPIVGVRRCKAAESHSMRMMHAAAVVTELGPITAV